MTNTLCICRGDSLDHLCRVHGNHPSNILPDEDHPAFGDNDGFSAKTLRQLEDAEYEDQP